MKSLLRTATLLLLLPFPALAGPAAGIVAVVNSDIVTSYQLDAALRERHAENESASASDTELRRQLLDQLIEEQLIAQRAAEIGLAVGDEEVEAAVADVEKQNRIDRKQLEEALARQGIPFPQYRETLRRQILRYKLLGRELQSRIEVSSREVRDYYQAHTDDYRQPPSLRLSHITFPFPAAGTNDDEGDASRRAAVRATAEAARARLGTAGFDALLADLKERKLAVGGDLGVIAEPEMDPAFVSAVRDLAPGGVTALVETATGLHVLRLEERTPGATLPFDSVKDAITDLLAEQKKKTAMQDWLAELRAKARIEIRN